MPMHRHNLLWWSGCSFTLWLLSRPILKLTVTYIDKNDAVKAWGMELYCDA